MERDLLLDLLQRVTGLYLGKYRGEVTDNDDSTSRGRLKVKVKAVLDDNEIWALPCVPYAGDGVGFYSLPPVGTAVWVEFEGGDPSYPIWTGCFWRDKEVPDTGGAAIKIWKTDKVTLRIDDDGDEALVKTSSDAALKLTDQIEGKVGANTHTVSTSGVVSDAGVGKVEVGAATVKINGGALEVT